MAEKPGKSSREPQIIPLPKRRTGSKTVGETLRKKYESIVDEPIPAHLQKMIDALREAERNEQNDD